jgi:transcriptional regulator with XRE-family HTH domain
MINNLIPSETLFPMLIDGINRTGLSDLKIEKRSGVARGTIRRLRQGFGANYDTIQTIQKWLVENAIRVSSIRELSQ